MASMESLNQWVAEVTRQLAEAGFAVKHFNGYPLVPSPGDLLENKRLIEFFPELHPPVRKEIWEEGMLFLPNL